MPVKDKGTVYSVPDTFFLRLHHCRPRFKNDVESVLIAIATVIGDMQEAPIEPFMDNLFLTIKNYPGNFNKTDKTIHNWKTEISTLFGLVEYHSPREGWCRPGATAKMLAENQDIPQFFKTFLFTFQYPGAHIKKQEIKNLIEAEVKFKPAKYIIEVLKTGEEQYSQFSITKAEATHCVFNDLRVTRDGRDAGETARLIQNNRSERFSYDETGDVIRYAGDILDYMVLANLLRIDPSGKYFSLNWAEIHAIDTFLSSSKWFGGYDHLYGQEMIGYGEIDEIFASWFHYVNDLSYNRNFSTNLSSFMSLEGREG
ncbi:MAG: hypothetical protein GX587_03480, partial [Bacteroidales bacterium]|nr:hypothetical protein [Bacteroidales bacterium]